MVEIGNRYQINVKKFGLCKLDRFLDTMIKKEVLEISYCSRFRPSICSSLINITSVFCLYFKYSYWK